MEVIWPVAQDCPADHNGLEASERSHGLLEVAASQAHDQHLGCALGSDLVYAGLVEHRERPGHPGERVVVDAQRTQEITELPRWLPREQDLALICRVPDEPGQLREDRVSGLEYGVVSAERFGVCGWGIEDRVRERSVWLTRGHCQDERAGDMSTTALAEARRRAATALPPRMACGLRARDRQSPDRRTSDETAARTAPQGAQVNAGMVRPTRSAPS